ncbi:hypothetical protein [Listeria monocytogenes]|uniref:hypothetical protein n=1 Tax=Listeria monocytogenes TaxID=1639 RepID=UPI0034A2F3F5|nr:hypothetical protein [Listeria monocytogenes]
MELKLGGRNSGKTVKINEEIAGVKKDLISRTETSLILRGNTQKEIDKMVDVLKAGEHFKRGFKRGLKNNSTSLKEVDIITVHSEDLTATIQRYLDLGYLCDVRAFRSKGYMEPEYQVVILKKE